LPFSPLNTRINATTNLQTTKSYISLASFLFSVSRICMRGLAPFFFLGKML
jgi:hypothetical protein